MKQGMMKRGVQIGLLVSMFATGFLVGSVTQRSANAQLKELGEAAMQKAAGSGGALGTAVQLGNAIVEMQHNVDGLQKNLDVLKKVKASLGG